MRVKKSLDLNIRFVDAEADEVKGAYEILRGKYSHKDIYLKGLREIKKEEGGER